MAKWFQRLYIPALLLIVTVGMLGVLKYGYEPPPQKLMAPSFFDTPEEIGAVVYRRLFGSLREEKLVFFGVPPQPEWHVEILRGFIKTAAAEGRPFERLVVETQMPELGLEGLPKMEVVSIPTNTPTQAELVDALSSQAGYRTLVYLPSIFATHLLDGNVLDRYREKTGSNPLSISTAPLALRPDQEYLVDPACVGSERDANGTSKLGCTILRSGRGYYRKNVVQDRWVAIMNSPYPNDNLVMISTPGQGRDHSEENADRRMAPPPARKAL
jgi:hypothetical protein